MQDIIVIILIMFGSAAILIYINRLDKKPPIPFDALSEEYAVLCKNNELLPMPEFIVEELRRLKMLP